MIKIDRLAEEIEFLKQKNQELISAIERREREIPYNYVLDIGGAVI
jgi:sporulation protein YlmC with PRC-barrel domain